MTSVLQPYEAGIVPSSRSQAQEGAVKLSGLFFTLGSIAKIYKKNIAMPLMGMAIGVISVSIAIKLSDAYEIQVLTEIVHKCYKLAENTKVLRIVLTILVLVSAFWFPNFAFYVAIPLTFTNLAYSIRRTQMT